MITITKTTVRKHYKEKPNSTNYYKENSTSIKFLLHGRAGYYFFQSVDFILGIIFSYFFRI